MSCEINIEATLFCGQSFAWTEEGGQYTAVLGDRVVRFEAQSLPSLLKEDEELAAYFDSDYDYLGAEKYLSLLDPHLERYVAEYRGLRILRQDPWEVLVSFILSQNNSIKRIRGLYRRLSETYGSEIVPGLYTFPRPEQLARADEDALRTLGLGFRAPYVLDAVGQHRLLETIENLDDELGSLQLQRIAGVGPKVASCILLFGFGRRDVFPLDVWMKRIMHNLYPDKDSSFFSPHGGLAQQYLFHGYRGEHGRR
jgi:N-glycosylase/DNA lyase